MTVPTTQSRNAAGKPLAGRVPLGRLPFVGLRRDGTLGYWVLPPESDGADPRLIGRTYAAWFLVYVQANGVDAGKQLMDAIEREMPSRHPKIDQHFLGEVGRVNWVAHVA